MPRRKPPSRLRVLVLESDPHMRGALGRALSDHDVDLVSDEAGARASMQARTHEAWLLDCYEEEQLALLAWARDAGMRTPALVTTAHASAQLANRAQRLGAEFLFKPYARANLDAFLSRAASRNDVGRALMHSVQAFADRHRLTVRERDVVEALARGGLTCRASSM